jgi:hypothetical protein
MKYLVTNIVDYGYRTETMFEDEEMSVTELCAFLGVRLMAPGEVRVKEIMWGKGGMRACFQYPYTTAGGDNVMGSETVEWILKTGKEGD